MHKEAWLWLFKDYPHRRLASYVYHSMRLGDSLDGHRHHAQPLRAEGERMR